MGRKKGIIKSWSEREVMECYLGRGAPSSWTLKTGTGPPRTRGIFWSPLQLSSNAAQAEKEAEIRAPAQNGRGHAVPQQPWSSPRKARRADQVAWQWAYTEDGNGHRYVGSSAQHHFCSATKTPVGSEGSRLTDSAAALPDTLLQVEGLTFRGEGLRPVWTVQSGAASRLLLTCSAHVPMWGRGLFPIFLHCLLLPTEKNQRMMVRGELQNFGSFLVNILVALELSFFLGISLLQGKARNFWSSTWQNQAGI